MLKALKSEGWRGWIDLYYVAYERLKSRKKKLNGVHVNNYKEWVKRYDTIDEQSIIDMQENIETFERIPLISIIMPVFNPRIEWLIEAIESILKQVYNNWELCLADDASTDKNVSKVLNEYRRKDDRIKVVFRKINGHISACSNSALELCSGEYVALVDQDDLLRRNTLYWCAYFINKNPKTKLLYSDEDKIDARGNRNQPYFKPDWNYDLFFSHNLITHLGVYKTSILRKIGGFRIGFEGSQDYDLAIRFIEQIDRDEIIHIPKILYHWRIHKKSTSDSIENKSYSIESAQKAISEYIDRNGINAKVYFNRFSMFDLRYIVPNPLPGVSIIIAPGELRYIKKGIRSIIKKTSFTNYEIIVPVFENEKCKIDFLKRSVKHNQIRYIYIGKPFNNMHAINKAVESCNGVYVCLIDAKISVKSNNWLAEMVSIADSAGVGAVGAKLLYPNNIIMHAGIILGLFGIAGYAFNGLPGRNPGYIARANLMQEYSALTISCLLMKRKIYLKQGGLREDMQSQLLCEIDFCLRLRQVGYRVVYTPFAELFINIHEKDHKHNEFTNNKDSIEEFNSMMNKWYSYFKNDPSYNSNLTLDYTDFSMAWPPRDEKTTMNI
ncbi:MAG: glycosyltransferase [Melioribacteraceae bacterium]|nr:glycosyltransferase [Melioribacteraceae bacterium]